MERRKREIELMPSRFGPLETGPNLDWILFRAFPLPPGWNRAKTELLVTIPPGYPTTPPDNFLVRTGLRLADGRTPTNYSEGHAALGSTWGVFSFHVRGWDPTGDHDHADSLLTFIAGVERRLRELN